MKGRYKKLIEKERQILYELKKVRAEMKAMQDETPVATWQKAKK